MTQDKALAEAIAQDDDWANEELIVKTKPKPVIKSDDDDDEEEKNSDKSRIRTNWDLSGINNNNNNGEEVKSKVN